MKKLTSAEQTIYEIDSVLGPTEERWPCGMTRAEAIAKAFSDKEKMEIDYDFDQREHNRTEYKDGETIKGLINKNRKLKKTNKHLMKQIARTKEKDAELKEENEKLIEENEQLISDADY